MRLIFQLFLLKEERIEISLLNTLQEFQRNIMKQIIIINIITISNTITLSDLKNYKSYKS